MFQKFRANLADKKKVKRIKKKIHLAYKLIYSEKYDFMQQSEQEKFIQKLTNTSNQIQLLENYFIVNCITKYSLPINEIEIAYLKQELDNIKLKLNSTSNNLRIELQEAYLKSEKAKMSINLLFKQQHLITGKAAFDEDAYSFQGLIYKMEKAGRRPISLLELEKLKNLWDQLYELQKKIDEKELELEEFKTEIEELKKLKEEIDKN